VAEQEPREPRAPGAPWLDQYLAIYLSDESLWPVLIVAFAVAVTLGGALLVAAVLTRNPVLWGAVGILALMSVDTLQRELRARRRLGVTNGAVLGLWLTSAGVAAAAIHFGWV
jgi:hypothetical protein